MQMVTTPIHEQQNLFAETSRMRASSRRKIWAIIFSTLVFTALVEFMLHALGFGLEHDLLLAFSIGLCVSLLEEFYVKGSRNRWFRSVNPMIAMCLYGLAVVALTMLAMLLFRVSFGNHHNAAEMMAPLPILLPILIIVSVVAIMILRIIGYHGARNLFHLMTGKYFRPVIEKRIFLFLDIIASTELVERLGPIEARLMIGKFFFDISKPITDWGGEVYRFTGDGAVIVWHWNEGIRDNKIVHAIDAIDHAVDASSQYYLSTFGQVPQYRMGLHGGDIVVSEEGDTRRSIGFYGDTIHIAARLERKAKELGRKCFMSGSIAKHLGESNQRLVLATTEHVRGISEPIEMYELLPRDAKIDEDHSHEPSSSCLRVS